MTIARNRKRSGTLVSPARRGEGEDRSIRTFTARFSQAAIDDGNSRRWVELFRRGDVLKLAPLQQ
jgi:hypothetical protein